MAATCTLPSLAPTVKQFLQVAGEPTDAVPYAPGGITCALTARARTAQIMCAGLVKVAVSCGCKGEIALIASGEHDEHVWRRLRDVAKRERGEGWRRQRRHRRAIADERRVERNASRRTHRWHAGIRHKHLQSGPRSWSECARLLRMPRRSILQWSRAKRDGCKSVDD